MNIFVAKLSNETNESDIRDLFERFGEVASVKIILDKETGRSKCYGFIEMTNDEEAQQAIEALDNYKLDNKNIAVKEAVSKEEHSRNRGGGGNRFDRNRNHSQSRRSY